MESGFRLKNENPRKSANILSVLCFTWMIRIFRKAIKEGLEVADLFITLEADKSEKLGNRLEKNWNDQLEKAKSKNAQPSLLRAVAKTFLLVYFIRSIGTAVLHIIVRSFQPVFLAYLINTFEIDESTPEIKRNMYIYGSIVVFFSAIAIFLNHHSVFAVARVGMWLRVSVSSLVYRKILKLNNKGLGDTASGQIVNLLSNDVMRFDMASLCLNYLWIMPFQIGLITFFLWEEVGISALAGVLSMAFLTLPGQGYLGKLTSKLRLRVAIKTDHRVKLMNEIIAGIQVIKMYAWEKPFEHMVKLARKTEITSLAHASYLRAIYTSSMVFIERTTLYLTIITFVLQGNSISADVVFSMAQFFNVLQLSMAIIYPMAISYGAESLVAIQRLQEFLLLEEIPPSSVELSTTCGVSLEKVDASWVDGTTPFLQNINISIPKGSLCAIVGPVGAGKSSILQLILGELSTSIGTIKVGGNISYACQEPWLFSGSVRNNILFGQPYDKTRYKKIVKVCALEKDFDQFPQRDQSLVGEKGASLSGGQRARINLARAVYRDADVYLLDDPLSAVDTHVGKHLFEKCVLDYLGEKTRVLVTHQLQYLKKADLIVVINNGQIEALGTFEELSDSNLDFTQMLVSSDESQQEKSKLLERKMSVVSAHSLVSEDLDTRSVCRDEEEIPENSSPLKQYFKAARSLCLNFTLIFILILGQSFCSCTDYFVTFWTTQESLRNRSVTPEPRNVPVELVQYSASVNNSDDPSDFYTYSVLKPIEEAQNVSTSNFFQGVFLEEIFVDNESHYILQRNVAIYIYSGFIVALIVVTFARSMLFFKVCMRASKNLHNTMFRSLLKTPMRFFDTNPSGRILNRFSKDMGAIDEILPRTLLEAIQITLVMCGILVMVVVANYYMVIAIAVLGLLFLKMRAWYLVSAKNIKHIEGNTKSPVFSYVNSTLSGLTTIRAVGAEKMLQLEFDGHQDVHSSAWYLTLACQFSFGLWLDIICVVFVACIVYSFIILNDFGQVSGSLVGLAISQSLILTGMLQYGIKQTAEVINQCTSVERVMQYTKLEQEGPFETPDDKFMNLPWPSKGLLEFRNVFLRYSPMDAPVLKDLNFVVSPAEKIGIVGRTGAGKSSLISALFRLTEIEGQIVIDGVDTKTIGLNDLRRKISIIPQEPVLFSASIRYNLDPFNEFDDVRLWGALEEVELKDSIVSLDYLVTSGGSNFSLGQRQLICLARAILRNNKILILDEATANVDPQTDTLIQATIRSKFRFCTVLTIAHRLNTIMDSDKVLVMDSGYHVEFDHPHILLQNPEGHFSRMLAQTGPTMSEKLKIIAQEAFNNQRVEKL